MILAGAFAPLVQAAGSWDPLPSQADPLVQRLRTPIYGLLAPTRSGSAATGRESWVSLGAQAFAGQLNTTPAAWPGPERLALGPDSSYPASPHAVGAFPELADLLIRPRSASAAMATRPRMATIGRPTLDFTVTTTSVTRYRFDLANWSVNWA